LFVVLAAPSIGVNHRRFLETGSARAVQKRNTKLVAELRQGNNLLSF